MNGKTQVSQWLDFAKDDLLAAHRLFEDYSPKQIFISCYHCQQAGEKALKAYLILKNVEFPFTHDLVKLCNLCMDMDMAFDDLLDACSDLTPYATQARYPNTSEITELITAAALRKAERILSFVADLVPAADEPLAQEGGPPCP